MKHCFILMQRKQISQITINRRVIIGTCILERRSTGDSRVTTVLLFSVSSRVYTTLNFIGSSVILYRTEQAFIWFIEFSNFE